MTAMITAEEQAERDKTPRIHDLIVRRNALLSEWEALGDELFKLTHSTPDHSGRARRIASGSENQ